MNKLKGLSFIIFLLCFFGAAAWHVLSNYGKDPEITRLVDTKAIYVRIKNNPDGSELYLNTAQSNRSTRGGVEKKKLQIK